MFQGDCLIRQLEAKRREIVDELRATLSPETNTVTRADKPHKLQPEGLDRWVELAGLLAPDGAAQKALGDIEDRTIKPLKQVTEAFQLIHNSMGVYECNLTVELLQQLLGSKTDQIAADNIAQLLTKWKKAVAKFRRLQIADAEKESTAAVQTGYGIDGGGVHKSRSF